MKHIRTAKTALLSLLLIFALLLVGCSSEEAAPAADENFSLSETAITLMTGQTKALQINDLKNIGPTAYTVFWASDNPAVATVDSNTGVVTAVSMGTCNVVAAVRSADGERQYTCAVTVSGSSLQASAISFKASIYTRGPGQALDLTKELNLTPSAAAVPTLIWTSSNPAIATVTNGIVVPLSPGITTITAATEDGSLSTSCAVQVSAVAATPTAIEFEEKAVDLYVGNHKALSAVVTPANATGYSISWSSSNPAIATVDGGIVTGFSEGSVIITARLSMGTSSLIAECTVTVIKATVEVPATSVTLTPDVLDLQSTDREPHSLKATIEPANCTQSAVWSTNRPDLIQLDPKTGSFYIIKEPLDSGATAVLVFCTVGGITSDATVYIHKEPSRLILEPDEVTIYDYAPKNTFELLAYKDKVNAQSEPLTGVTWESEDEKIATVDKNGVVTAVKIGTTTITASYEIEGKVHTATCEVKVEKAPYLIMKVGETIPITDNLLPEKPSQKLEDWIAPAALVEVDPVNKTIKALKASDSLVQIVIYDENNENPSSFQIYIEPAEEAEEEEEQVPPPASQNQE